MATAKYTLLVPSFPDVARAVYEYLNDGPIKTTAINVLPGDPWTQVHAWAEDIPEVDSHMKQLGTFAAQAVNAPNLTVMKDGKNGVNTWEMKNNQYQPLSVHDELANQHDEAGSSNDIDGSGYDEPMPHVLTEPTSVPTPGSGDGVKEQMLDEGHQVESPGSEMEQFAHDSNC